MSVRVIPWKPGPNGEKRHMVDVRGERPDGTPFRDRKIIVGPKSAAQGWGDKRHAVLLGELHAPEPKADDDAEPVQVLTVAEWAPTFVARHYQGKKQSAIDAAQSIMDTHVLPFVGSRKLDQLTTPRLADLVLTWRRGGYRECKRDRIIKRCDSEKTINNRKVVVISMLKYAVKCSEDTGLTKMPGEIKLAKVDSQKPPEFYELDVYARIIAASGDLDPCCLAMVLLGGDCGLRVSEMISLKWTDVNFRTGKITVRTSVYQRNLEDRFEGPTKGGEEKPVKMPARVAEALKRLARNGDNVMHNDDGEPLTMKAIKWLAKKVEKAAKLTVSGRVHIYRHTYCTHLAMAGVPARQIMDMARHADLSTTLRYMHAGKDGQDHAIDALEKLRAAG